MPAAFDAAMLIAAIYFFLRRFRPGSELDGAFITASSRRRHRIRPRCRHRHAAGRLLSPSHLLGWYAWYESRQRIYLAAFYVFLALGTLAKGPVAPALSAVIIFLFVAAQARLVP